MDDYKNNDWGFEVTDGDQEEYPDLTIYLEFDKTLSVEDQQSIKEVFGNWYKRGVGDRDTTESEFGGTMHNIDNPEFNNNYAGVSTDFGSVEYKQAFPALLKALSDWNNKQSGTGSAVVKKVVFGWEKEIAENLHPEHKA